MSNIWTFIHSMLKAF